MVVLTPLGRVTVPARPVDYDCCHRRNGQWRAGPAPRPARKSR